VRVRVDDRLGGEGSICKYGKAEVGFGRDDVPRLFVVLAHGAMDRCGKRDAGQLY
jgi:hypothetical protein